MVSNLPKWPGADVCYTRAYTWMAVECQKAYRTAPPSRAGKPRAYTIPDDVEAMQTALNIGDEETIKALNHRYIHHWGNGHHVSI